MEDNAKPQEPTPQATLMNREEIYIYIKMRILAFIDARKKDNPSAGEFFEKSITFSDKNCQINFNKVPIPPTPPKK